MGRSDKLIKIKMHDAYSSFLSHLYEFYVGCEQREINELKKFSFEYLDRFFNGQACRQLNNRREAIEKGYAPSWENHISYYQLEVPDNFGRDFRLVRNRTSHVITERASPKAGISLADFFHRYHKFIYLLYFSGKWWLARDIESYDWQSIEDFDLSVKEAGIPTAPD